MPIYEYECKSCHKIFERLKPRPLCEVPKVRQCPFCGGVGKHIISKTFFRLKGEGWADTGYSKKIKGNNNDTN